MKEIKIEVSGDSLTITIGFNAQPKASSVEYTQPVLDSSGVEISEGVRIIGGDFYVLADEKARNAIFMEMMRQRGTENPFDVLNIFTTPMPSKEA